MRISDWSSDVCSSDLGRQQAVAPGGDAALEFVLALLQGLDFDAQGLDLAFAQQRALLGRSRAQYPHPPGAEALDVAGDHGFALATPRLQRARLVQGFGHVQARQQLAARQRRSEKQPSELQSLMRISYADFCLY